MDQATQHARLCELLQMLAWLAKTSAAHEYGADLKFTVDEMIERNTARHYVAAGFLGSELDPEPLS